MLSDKNQEKFGIVGSGGLIVDHIKLVDTWPTEGTLANILELKVEGGGSPYNVLIDLAKIDPEIRLAVVGIMGDDAEGEFLLSQFRKFNVDASGVKKTTKYPTSYTDVMSVKGTPRRTFFHDRGANRLLDIKVIEPERLNADIFHVGYILLLDSLDSKDPEYGTVMARLLHRVRERGIKISVDVASEDSNRYPEIVVPALKYVDYCIINEIEAERTASFPIRRPDGKIDYQNLRKAARFFLENGVNEIVSIHMAEGGYLFTKRREEYFQPSLQLPEEFIQGTAGAGDAFVAGMLYGFHQKWEITRSLDFAVRTAAVCLNHSTTTGALTSYDKIMEITGRFPYRNKTFLSG